MAILEAARSPEGILAFILTASSKKSISPMIPKLKRSFQRSPTKR